MTKDRARFKRLVNDSLKLHYELIQKLCAKGTYFFDYGNAFLKAVFDAGVTQVSKNGVDAKDGFVYPSYFEDIMGPIFDYGYGPFRWVCLSGTPEDLDKTDAAAMSCIDPDRRSYDRDNYVWIRDAKQNKLVVGSQARILYQDAAGRVSIALKFNEMVRTGEVSAPIMLGRDHHDPGGTDSPFRETANIYDGSNVCADMATHCFAGNAARGMSMVALHNGGGTGIGQGHQRRVRPGTGRQRTRGFNHQIRHALGCHGRGGPKELGRQSQCQGSGCCLQCPKPQWRPNHHPPPGR